MICDEDILSFSLKI